MKNKVVNKMPDDTLTWAATSADTDYSFLRAPIYSPLKWSYYGKKKCPLSRSKDIVDAEDEEE